MTAQLNLGRVGIDARRAEVQTRLDGVPETNVIRIDVLVARLENIDESLTNVEASIGRLTGRQADLEARLIELGEIVTRLSARIERLEGRCESVDPDATPNATPNAASVAANDNIVLNYLHSDHLGRPAFATDTDGEIIWDGGITTPFGVQIETLGALTQNLMFPGQYEDEETGFYYNWHRTYDPTLGRYLQSDPIGLAGGLNRYAYVGGNPMGAVDFEGLVTIAHPSGGSITLPNPQLPAITRRAGVYGAVYAGGYLTGYYGAAYYYYLKHLAMQNEDCSNDNNSEADCKRIKNECIQGCSDFVLGKAPRLLLLSLLLLALGSSGFEHLINAPRPFCGGASIDGLIRFGGKGRPSWKPVGACLFDAMPCHTVLDNLLFLFRRIANASISYRLSCNVFDHCIDGGLIAQDVKKRFIWRPVIAKVWRGKYSDCLNFTAIHGQCLAETEGLDA